MAGHTNTGWCEPARRIDGPPAPALERHDPVVASQANGATKRRGISHSTQNDDLERTCQFCSRTFTKSVTCQRHVDTVHGGGTGRFECSFCAKTFGRKDTMERHVKTHTKQGYVQCGGCGGSYRRDYLKQHFNAIRGGAQCKAAHEASATPAPTTEPSSDDPYVSPYAPPPPTPDMAVGHPSASQPVTTPVGLYRWTGDAGDVGTHPQWRQWERSENCGSSSFSDYHYAAGTGSGSHGLLQANSDQMFGNGYSWNDESFFDVGGSVSPWYMP